jgi:hypothetical protein
MSAGLSSFAILAATITGMPAADAKKPSPKHHKGRGKGHSASEAQKSVVKEIAARYYSYDPNITKDRGVHDTASCSPLTNTKFKCTWEATNNDIQSFGKAVVTFFPKGTQVSFSDVSCSTNYSNPNANPVAAQVECDTNPHN